MAEIVPAWSDPSPVTFTLPAIGTGSYEAAGFVEVGTLDAILVYDVSGSMGFDTGEVAPNGGEERGDWGEAGAIAFVEALSAETRLGLNQFSGSSSVVVPLDRLGDPGSDQRLTLSAAINGLPRSGSTNIAAGVELAADLLTDPLLVSDSKHIVLVTDGESSADEALAAVDQALLAGVETINTVGLPGADTQLLADLAQAGSGEFVDGTNLSNLIDQFAGILDDAETLTDFAVFDETGGLLASPILDSESGFSVSLPIVEGENRFVARATSSLGNVSEAELVVVGVIPIPEPGAAALIALATACLAMGSKYPSRWRA